MTIAQWNDLKKKQSIQGQRNILPAKISPEKQTKSKFLKLIIIN